MYEALVKLFSLFRWVMIVRIQANRVGQSMLGGYQEAQADFVADDLGMTLFVQPAACKFC